MPIFQKKPCFFCQHKMRFIDYKNSELIHNNLDYFNQIKPAEHTGTCLRHQKMLSTAVKRSRHLALSGFVR